MPVAHVERLEGLAFLSVEEAAVGERAVHVEHDQPDAAQELARRLPGSRRHACGLYQNRKAAPPEPTARAPRVPCRMPAEASSEKDPGGANASPPCTCVNPAVCSRVKSVAPSTATSANAARRANGAS